MKLHCPSSKLLSVWAPVKSSFIDRRQSVTGVACAGQAGRHPAAAGKCSRFTWEYLVIQEN